jgi:hypothetical protein
VRVLADRLRSDGIDCRIDQYIPFPSEGWPRWMAREIETADFVLVVCTEIYARRAEGREAPDRGYGVSWEGLLITQEIYENGGRNAKFVPVVLKRGDTTNIPAFLAPATRFNLEDDAEYESLLRLLTRQPAVLMPPVGPVRLLPPVSGQGGVPDVVRSDIAVPTLLETETPVIIWKLPRGFILIENLVDLGHSAWSTLANYYDYRGQCFQGTHYHDSYRWSDKDGAIQIQLKKLGIPSADQMYARSALSIMMDVREHTIIVGRDGAVSGRTSLLQEPRCVVVGLGSVPLPTRLPQDRSLAISGPLRDLADEAYGLLRVLRHPGPETKPYQRDASLWIARIRREVRLEVHRLLASSHPAVRNLEDLIARHGPTLRKREQTAWLEEFAGATQEAIDCVHDQAAD